MDSKNRFELGTSLPDAERPICGIRRKLFWIWLAGGICVILIAVGVGVGAGYALNPKNDPEMVEGP